MRAGSYTSKTIQIKPVDSTRFEYNKVTKNERLIRKIKYNSVIDNINNFINECKKQDIKISMLLLNTTFHNSLVDVGVPIMSIPVILQHKLRGINKKMTNERLKVIKRILGLIKYG